MVVHVSTKLTISDKNGRINKEPIKNAGFLKLNFSCIDFTYFHLPEEGVKYSETGRNTEEIF